MKSFTSPYMHPSLVQVTPDSSAFLFDNDNLYYDPWTHIPFFLYINPTSIVVTWGDIGSWSLSLARIRCKLSSIGSARMLACICKQPSQAYQICPSSLTHFRSTWSCQNVARLGLDTT
eukprot:TRINITY_DN13394_c4_g1_i1.p1 TRINITY_DN13394_c4_g1~~TRINITY_DN13394_c4_g1_i1.p1  ORF type:complete len:118 (+),score=10.85 TRINITY_DN13394_c4_g1_i1:873-1226(+)